MCSTVCQQEVGSHCSYERVISNPAFVALWKVCTNRSAAPFHNEWYRAHLMCLIPFICRNEANSAETNCGLLSETNCSGRPYAAKIFLSSMMVLCAVVVAISTTSGHFECASMTIKKFSHKGFCKIDMYPLPGLGRPHPRGATAGAFFTA